MLLLIAAHPTTLEIYGDKLVAEGVLSKGDVEKMKADWRAHLDAELESAQSYRANKADWLDGRWSGFKSAGDSDDPRRGKTGVEIATLKEIGHKITTLPPNFHLHRTLNRFIDSRGKAIETGAGIDWSTAEALAFCSLLLEGHRVRAVLVRTPGAALSRSAIPCADRSGKRAPLHAVQSSGRESNT